MSALGERVLVDDRPARAARAQLEPDVAARSNERRALGQGGHRSLRRLLRRLVRRRGAGVRARGGGRRLRRGRRAAELPAEDRGDDREDGDGGDERPARASAPGRRRLRPAERQRLQRLVAVFREAAVVFVEIEIGVEVEEVRVRAQEALDVHLSGQQLPALLLERLQVAVADPDRPLDVRGREPALDPRLAETGPDREHVPIVADRRLGCDCCPIRELL